MTSYTEMRYVMLIAFKNDNTTGSLWLCRVLYMLGVFYELIYISASVFIYNNDVYGWCDYWYESVCTIDC